MPSWIYFLLPRDDFAATMSDPAIAGGVVTGELRVMRVSLLRGRD